MIINPYNVQPAGGNRTLSQIITALGLGANLQLALDAGDSASYTSGQKWLDTSGIGTDFFRGVDINAAADDPTFNGTPGGLSSAEYWGFDGGDFFTHDAANPTWVQNLHKDNAAFTIILRIYFGALTSNQRLFATFADFGTGTGFVMTANITTGMIRFDVKNAGVNVLNRDSTTAAVAAGWNCIGLSIDEAAGSGGVKWVVNGGTNTADSTYTSPAAGNATSVLTIGATPGPFGALLTGARMSHVAAWSSALSLTDMANVSALMRR